MYKKVLVGLVLLSLFTVIIAACGVREPAAASNGPTVKMSSVAFEVTEIKVPKGQALTITDDVAVPHIIKNGSWTDSKQVPKTESGAPTVDLNFNGSQGESQTTAIFNAAGTYHLFCTIHTNMNLTVTVQ